MRLRLNALCLLLTATPIFSFDPSNLFSIFKRPQQDVATPPETYEEFLSRYQDGCPVHKFAGVRIVSRRPEIILIDGFLTDHEAQALVTIAYSPHLAAIALTLAGILCSSNRRLLAIRICISKTRPGGALIPLSCPNQMSNLSSKSCDVSSNGPLNSKATSPSGTWRIYKS
jgi:hypothetical protein